MVSELMVLDILGEGLKEGAAAASILFFVYEAYKTNLNCGAALNFVSGTRLDEYRFEVGY
jgi:hypothetical protein